MSEVNIGDVCVVPGSTAHSWFRARVIDVKDDDVSVLYVDYGNSAVVSKSQVREVAEPFVTWPVHVLRCSLADVQPMGAQHDDVSVRQWDEESRARFRELCDDVTSDRDSK